MSRCLAAAAIAALAVLGVATARGQAPGATASVVGGTLQVTEDPGVAGDLGITYEPDGRRYVIDASGGAARPGEGCAALPPSKSSCAGDGVERIAIDAGDGSDRVELGSYPPTVTIGVPVVVALGAGDDSVAFSLADQPVVVDAGPGNDDVSPGFAAYPQEKIAAAQVDLGPGDDRAEAYDVLGEVRIHGGEGNDYVSVFQGGGPARLDGGPGRDVVEARLRTPPTEMLGVTGRDALIDGSAGAGHNGRVIMHAGPGDDRILVRPDRDRDLIDCGAGNDELAGTDYFNPPATPNNRYINCPPVGVRVARLGRLTVGGEAAIRVTSPAPARATARLFAASRPATTEVRGLRLHRGRSTIRFRLRPGSPSARRGRFVVRLTAISLRGDDHVVLRRRVVLTRA